MSAELSKIVANGFEMVAAEFEAQRAESKVIHRKLDRIIELLDEEAAHAERQSERLRALEKSQ